MCPKYCQLESRLFLTSSNNIEYRPHCPNRQSLCSRHKRPKMKREEGKKNNSINLLVNFRLRKRDEFEQTTNSPSLSLSLSNMIIYQIHRQNLSQSLDDRMLQAKRYHLVRLECRKQFEEYNHRVVNF